MLVTHNAYYGATTGDIWLDSLQCTGEELDIVDCTHSGWGVTASACTGHSSDAGVSCLCMYNYVIFLYGLHNTQVCLNFIGKYESLHRKNYDLEN